MSIPMMPGKLRVPRPAGRPATRRTGTSAVPALSRAPPPACADARERDRLEPYATPRATAAEPLAGLLLGTGILDGGTPQDPAGPGPRAASMAVVPYRTHRADLRRNR